MMNETSPSSDRAVAVLIGAGRMGEIHARNASATPSLELRYVVDEASDRADRLEAAVGARPSTLDAALADPEVRAMIVATSTDAHEAVVRTGIDRGLAVLCEKPLTGDVSTSAMLAQRAIEARTPLMIGFHKRFDPVIAELRRVLSSGLIGELVSLSLISRDPSPPADIYDIGGGAFFDMMIHDFDLVGWLVDDRPASVLATQSREVARCVIDLESGPSIYMECGRRSVSSYDQTIEVIGTVGAVRILDDEHAVSTTFRGIADRRQHWGGPLLGEAVKPFFLPRFAEAFAAEMTAFGAMALGGPHAGATAEDGLRAALLAAAATESSKASTRVQLGPYRAARASAV
ncbi:Gfo/Idh/MocA family oxidoreductase [Streptomyces sp. NPDC059698]|uniref:Gfo/Idh/MocA family oxidoreductase n=2 Tax=Streptomyces TaxID=1883 RepID=UPI0009A10A6C|nr:Gfo/Idh/MocA family oxidoreductase [Streptomyces sp. CB02366]